MTSGKPVTAPLNGLRVIEVGEFIAAPYAGRLLGLLGAEVIKVELPGDGDIARRYGPFLDRPGGTDGHAPESGDDESGLFAYLNDGKHSVAIDYRLPRGRELLQMLASQGDIVIVSLDPAEQDDAGLTYDVLRDLNDLLVVASITGYGRTGPKRDFACVDLTASAAAAISVGIGLPGREPLPLPLFQTDFQGGLAAAAASLVAVLASSSLAVTGRSARGQQVDISTVEVMATLYAGIGLPRFVYEGKTGIRNGTRHGIGAYPQTVLPCKDGHVALTAPQLAQWVRFVKAMGNPEWASNPRYRDRRAMADHYPDEADALLIPWFAKRTKAELLAIFIESRLPFAPLFDANDLLTNDHLREREYFDQVPLSRSSGHLVEMPGPPFRFSRSAVRPRGRGAPLLGQDTAEVLARLCGVADGEWERLLQAGVIATASAVPNLDSGHSAFPHEMKKEGMPVESKRGAASSGAAPSGLPLAGLRVLDLGSAWAGPMAGHLLADMGAEVIKVESRSHLDGLRMGRPIVVVDEAGGDEGLWPDLQPSFHALNRNKRSLALNLRHPEATSLVLRLVAESDVLIENFSPGVMERFGLDYPTLNKTNPRLVVASQSAAGLTGPLRDVVGYAPTLSALSGMSSVVGYPGGEPLGTTQIPYSDSVAASTTVLAVLAALYERQRSGEGEFIEVSQWEAMVALAPELVLERTMRGVLLDPQGVRHRLHCPHGTYPCSGEDAWLSLAVCSDADWRTLCSTLGLETHGADPAWPTVDRLARRNAIDAMVAASTRELPQESLAARLQSAGIAAAAVVDIEGMFFDEHLAARGAFPFVQHPLVGEEPVPGVPWHLDSTPGSVRTAAPLLGADNRDITRALLGMSDAEHQRLVDCGAIE